MCSIPVECVINYRVDGSVREPLFHGRIFMSPESAQSAPWHLKKEQQKKRNAEILGFYCVNLRDYRMKRKGRQETRRFLLLVQQGTFGEWFLCRAGS